MSVVFARTSGPEYVPKYLFVAPGERQLSTGKSRHVMKEFLRKRDSTRRQKQLAARSQCRILPWLRREDMEQVLPQVDGAVGDVGISPDSSSDSSSRPSSPQQSQWTAESTVGESHSSPTFSTSRCVLDCGRLSKSSMNPSHTPQGLLDYLHDTVIGRLYETAKSSNIMSPATAMANHTMTRSASARILLAISSLNRDIEAGYRTPTSDTLGLILEGIRLLKQHLQRPDGISDDTVLAVLSLWTYEVTLSMGFARTRSGPDSNSTRMQMIPKSLPNNIEPHLNGLQRSIKCCGGLPKLSSETLWALAWCVSTMPGYSPIDTRIMEPTASSTRASQSAVYGYYCLTRLFDTLSKIQRHMSSPDSLSGILDEPSFSPLRKTLLRLNAMRRSFNNQTTPMSRMRKSAALVSTLLFIFNVLLGGTDCADQEARDRRNDLLRAQTRLVDHRIDEEGSFEKVWQILMTEQESPKLQLHPRTWPIVEMVNVIKHLNAFTMDALSQSLLGYLLPEACDHATEEFRYEKLLLQIHLELDGLADLT